MQAKPNWISKVIAVVFAAAMISFAGFMFWHSIQSAEAEKLQSHRVYHQKMEDLRQRSSGLFDEFPLFQPTHSPGFESRIHGNFSGGGGFLAWGLSGELGGQGKTNTTITFVWIKDGRIYKNTLPESEIVFEKGNGEPTVKFAYWLPEIPTINPKSSEYLDTSEPERIVEKYQSALNLTPGQLVASKYLAFATIKMKPELLTQQLGIPMQSK